MKNSIESLYIHIPFCHQLCNYCDFAKLYVNDDLVEKYVEALKVELQLKLRHQPTPFKSIYFGGGTPSVLKKAQLDSLFQILTPFFSSEVEVTFEMNPEDVTKEYIDMLAELGVNRVSLGVQTFNDQLLRVIGRNHNAEQSKRAIILLQESSINNVTIDLMFALPGQTKVMLEEDIELIKSYDLPHVSLYSLILEERTKMYIQRKEYDLIDDEIEASMYEYVILELEKSGYIQYEISNFTKTELYRSKHNLAYWHQNQYYGVGLGAHEFINNKRYANTRSITQYIKKILNERTIPIVEVEELSNQQLLEEFCFLAFRDRQKGLIISELQQKHPSDYQKFSETVFAILQKLKDKGLVEEYEVKSFRLTRKGLMFANDVFSAFVQIEIS